MPHKDARRPRGYSAAALQELFEVLEHRSYFDLAKRERKTVDSLTQTCGISIDAWTFVLHPAVIEALQPTASELTRYIFTIDTLRSGIYFRIKEFLLAQKINVSSYYSGGWADFICDAYFTDATRRRFFSSLEDALKQAGAAQLSPNNDVGRLITLFRVEESLVLCGRTLASFGSPTYEVRQQIVEERVKFETIYRNYRSQEALQFFGGSEKKISSYLKFLREERVILCYDVISDYPRFVDTEYVPLCQATRVMDTILKAAQGNKDLWHPIVDILEVRPEQVTDSAENEVTHIFLNEYIFPGDRQRWKSLLYETGGEAINLYTYPLEGVLNESPIHLSDLPEALARASAYAIKEPSAIHIGKLFHPLALEDPVSISLSRECFFGQGVTLGSPGTGKTNTDLILAAGAARAVASIVIVDATGGIAGKLDLLAEESARPIDRVSIGDNCSETEIDHMLDDLWGREGVFLVEPDRSVLPKVVDNIFRRIESGPDKTSGNRSREISGFLLIEEANDAWGTIENERRERLRALEALLNKAWRKGWCIWLSSQAPSHLGFDEMSINRILSLLKNRIIHDLGGNVEEMRHVTNTFRSEKLSAEDLDYVESSLQELPAWSAIVRATAREGGKAVDLRPIVVRVRMLGKV